jgi:hypothetical protein
MHRFVSTIIRSNVVFPLPLGPMIAVQPERNEALMRSNTVRNESGYEKDRDSMVIMMETLGWSQLMEEQENNRKRFLIDLAYDNQGEAIVKITGRRHPLLSSK